MKRVRALQTVHGSYPCPKGEQPDHTQTELIQNDDGHMVKVVRGFRKFSLVPEHYRAATQADKEQDKKRVEAGEESRMTPDGLHLFVPATPAHADLPDDVADSLVARGLVEIVKRPPSQRAA